VLSALLAALVYYGYRYQQFLAWRERTDTLLRSLASKRPPDVPRDQWEFVVGWTVNLHANCGTIPDRVALDKATIFTDQLAARIGSDQITLNTIDWIWDQYEVFTATAGHYAQLYRPTIPGRLENAVEGCFGLKVE